MSQLTKDDAYFILQQMLHDAAENQRILGDMRKRMCESRGGMAWQTHEYKIRSRHDMQCQQIVKKLCDIAGVSLSKEIYHYGQNGVHTND